MSTKVSVEEKKDFIRWFLKNYKLRRRECVWILNYLLNHDNILKHVVFVEEGVHYCNRGMLMTTTGSEEIPFRFFKGDIMTADAEKAFHDIRLNSEEVMYIQITFPGLPGLEYLSVVEENPYMPPKPQDQLDAEELLEQSLKDGEKRRLMESIDKALDEKDKEAFITLSKKYANMC